MDNGNITDRAKIVSQTDYTLRYTDSIHAKRNH